MVTEITNLNVFLRKTQFGSVSPSPRQRARVCVDSGLTHLSNTLDTIADTKVYKYPSDQVAPENWPYYTTYVGNA